MEILRKGWQWFWPQSWLNKIIILGLFAVLVPFVLPTVVAWFRPTMIHVGVAFYTDERAYRTDGNVTTYFLEKRNLVTNCRLRYIEEPAPVEATHGLAPQSWVVIKLLLENVSNESLTDLRLGVRSPAISPRTQIVTAPNLDATGKIETPPRDARQMYMIAIPALAPSSSAVISLKTPIDESLRAFIYEKRRTVTIQVPFVSSNQFREYPPIVSRTNAVKVLNREGLLRSNEDTASDEPLQFTNMPLDESDQQHAAQPYQLLPSSKSCSEGEAGMW